MATSRKHETFDTLLQLKDAGAVTASAAAQVGGADKILDLGDGLVDSTILADVSAIDVVTGDEKYQIEVQGSSSSSFATVGAVLAILMLGGASVTFEAAASVVGRYTAPFRNEKGGTHFRYVRLFHRISGTTPSINYTAYVGKD